MLSPEGDYTSRAEWVSLTARGDVLRQKVRAVVPRRRGAVVIMKNQTVAGSVDLVEDGDRSVVRLQGELDAALEGELTAALSNARERRGPVVLDASRLTFADSTAISALLEFATRAREEGSDVSLRDAPESVLEVLDLLGVRALLTP